MKQRIEEIIRGLLAEPTAFQVSVPEKQEFGHYATNVALLVASRAKRSPRETAEEFIRNLKQAAPGLFARVEVAGPGFINMWIAPEAVREEFEKVSKERTFGRGKPGSLGSAIVEYSQPNIAKQLHTGHLRNTVLGSAVANVLEFSGWRVIRWNYLGDWGTQFGKLIVAYKRWGKKSVIEKNPIEELEKLYIRFHEAAKNDEALEAAGREEFRKLEAGDRENKLLWNWFKKVSLKEVGEVYKMLGAAFDTYIGEAFFESKMAPLVAELLARGAAKESEGAVVVPLEDRGLPPALIRKSDGASLYLTRDIAALAYRTKKYRPEKFLYVVGNEQTLHFAQLFAVAEKLGLARDCELTHLKYGLLLGETGKKMSTREGTAIPVRALIEKAVALAGSVVRKKNPGLAIKKREAIARAVGIGALKYALLKENRMSDIVFDWEKMLDLRGDSGPYLQYTHARLVSILRKSSGKGGYDLGLLTEEPELALMRKILEFPEAVALSVELLATNALAQYLYELGQAANKFYETTRVLTASPLLYRNALLRLVRVASRTLERGMALLGIEAPKEI